MRAIKENPIFVQALGMCPTLAVTTCVQDALGMGIATMCVLIGSNSVIAALKKIIPREVRIPAYIVIIATFVTLVEMVISAYAPTLHESLGVFIPLIVVNCLVLGRAESFASQQGVGKSALDGVSMGVGFTASLVLLGGVREVLGKGTFAGIVVLGEAYPECAVIGLAPGAFLVLGILMGVFKALGTRRKEHS